MTKKHPTEIKGWNGSLEDLAKSIGAMRYDQVSQFIHLLATDIRGQGRSDLESGRNRLAARLLVIAQDLEAAKTGMDNAWKICEPHEG